MGEDRSIEIAVGITHPSGSILHAYSHPEHGEVDVTRIIATLTGNADKGRSLIGRLPALLGADRAPCPEGCDRALEYAILTAPEARDQGVLAKLDAVAGRVL